MKAFDAVLILLAFCGVAAMFGNQEFSFTNRDVVGMVLMIGSAAVYALTVIIYKKHMREYSVFELVFYQNVVGALAFLPFLFLSARVIPVRDAAIAAGYFGLVVGTGAFLLIFYALKRLSTIHFSLAHYAEVLFAVPYGILFLGESLTWSMVLGGALIVLAGWLLIRQKSSRDLTAIPG